MTAGELRAVVAAVVPDASLDEAFETATIDVPASTWLVAATALRNDDGAACSFFDWLSAYDAGGRGLAIVARLWSVERRQGIVLRTHVDHEGGAIASLTPTFPGADWHERETYEMFGVTFEGHPHLVPLLLPNGFEGNPLRKDFVLASRVAKAWPGAKEPGESDADLLAGGTSTTRRRRARPPGVPDPGAWGES
jgi:NADH-quinone oxidoreductase subunit C